MHLILLRFHRAQFLSWSKKKIKKKGKVDLTHLEFHWAFNPLSDDIAKLIVSKRKWETVQDSNTAHKKSQTRENWQC